MSDLSAPLPPACDVVVLGGGASGSSIAYQLAKRGVDVLLLEAGDIGQGASGRNGGLLDTAVDPASPLVDYYYRSAELWPVLAEELARHHRRRCRVPARRDPADRPRGRRRQGRDRRRVPRPPRAGLRRPLARPRRDARPLAPLPREHARRLASAPWTARSTRCSSATPWRSAPRATAGACARTRRRRRCSSRRRAGSPRRSRGATPASPARAPPAATPRPRARSWASARPRATCAASSSSSPSSRGRGRSWPRWGSTFPSGPSAARSSSPSRCRRSWRSPACTA